MGALPPEARTALAAGRLWATRAAPYLSHAVLALRPVVVVDAPAGADLSAFPVDGGWRVYVDPAVLAVASPAEVGFWHLHQVAHLLRRHERRCPLPGGAPAPAAGRTQGQRWWNEACDAEVDDDLVRDLRRQALPSPPRALEPVHLGEPDGELAEAYFRGRPRSLVDPAGPSADCGSGVDGRPRPWEARPDDGAQGLSELERSLLVADTARRVREATRRRGEVPAGWQRWAERELEPVVDWRRLLAVAVRRGLAVAAGRVDYSYSRPSRRAAAVPGVVLPTMRRPAPRVAVVVDTSGSVDEAMLGQALAEVAGLLRQVGASARGDAVRLIACDAQAHRAQRVFDARAVQLLGGGGTDMRVGLDAAVALRPAPDLVVVLTDGFTPWPTAPPAVRVVVALLGGGGSCPPWAERVLVQPVGAPR